MGGTRLSQYLIAAILGVIEGLTEFLPVSSTGHLVLLGHFFKFQGPPGKTFEIMIQLGAVLALCILYFRKLLNTVVGLPTDAAARRFAFVIVLAFLPAALVGVLFHRMIEEKFLVPSFVAVMLVLGGVAILLLEELRKRPLYYSVDEIPPRTGLLVGVAQCIALMPGVSRSGATIIGGLLLGLERRTAAEFSFFLSIPTMAGAFVFSAFKHRHELSFDDAGLIATGFIAAFLAALLVVKPFLAIVSRIGFLPFAAYRIALGVFVLVLIYVK